MAHRVAAEEAVRDVGSSRFALQERLLATQARATRHPCQRRIRAATALHQSRSSAAVPHRACSRASQETWTAAQHTIVRLLCFTRCGTLPVRAFQLRFKPRFQLSSNRSG